MLSTFFMLEKCIFCDLSLSLKKDTFTHRPVIFIELQRQPEAKGLEKTLFDSLTLLLTTAKCAKTFITFCSDKVTKCHANTA